MQTSRKLNHEKGILGEPESRLSRFLPETTISLVMKLCQNDEFCRMIASKKDFIRIGRN